MAIFPKLIVSVARPIWNRFSKTRYKRDKALKGFADWWRSFSAGRRVPDGLRIVYGHTHLIDVFTSDDVRAIVGKEIQQRLMLINHASWVTDTREKFSGVLKAIFLYIDSNGFAFFGWDWNAKRPFHIPWEVVRMRTEGGIVTQEVEDWLRRLDWPNGLIERWKEPLVI